MTSAGAFLRALAAAKPPNPPPTITTRAMLLELELSFAIFDCGSHSFSSFRTPRFHKFLRFVPAQAKRGHSEPAPCYERNCWFESSPAHSNIKDLRDLFGRLFGHCLNNSEITPGI